VTWLHWSLLSAAFAGTTAVLAKAGVRDVHPDLATAIRTTVVVVLAWSIALARVPVSVATVSPRAWLFLTLSGLATGGSWLCYFRALRLGEVSRVAPVEKLSVVVAMALAAMFLGEPITWRHWLGGGLVIAGAVLLARP
jgi:bacterial/archaeal transporter family protein